jgi:hypothetical protein
VRTRVLLFEICLAQLLFGVHFSSGALVLCFGPLRSRSLNAVIGVTNCEQICRSHKEGGLPGTVSAETLK